MNDERILFEKAERAVRPDFRSQLHDALSEENPDSRGTATAWLEQATTYSGATRWRLVAASVLVLATLGGIVWVTRGDGDGSLTPTTAPSDGIAPGPETTTSASTPSEPSAAATTTRPATSTTPTAPTTTAKPRPTNIAGPWPTPPTEPPGPPPTYLVATEDALGLTVTKQPVDVANWAGSGPTYEQIFVSASTTLQVTTRSGAVPGGGVPADSQTLGQWQARTRPMAPSFAAIDLFSDHGTVALWAQGLSTDELFDIALTLTRRGEDPGWETGPLPNELRPVDAGWQGQSATYILEWQEPSGGRRAAELQYGCCELSWFTVYAGEQQAITTVRGTQATIWSSADQVRIAWTEAPGLYARLASSGLTMKEALQLVEDLDTVDRNSWEALPTQSPEGDGCSSLFC